MNHRRVPENHIDDYDDDQIMELSTTRQRWELLHGIKATAAVGRNDGNEINLADDDDDDEIIMITTTKPIQLASQPPFWTLRQHLARTINDITMDGRYGKACLSFMGPVIYVISLTTLVILFWKRWQGRKKSEKVCFTISNHSKEAILHDGTNSHHGNVQVVVSSSAVVKKNDDTAVQTCSAVSVSESSTIVAATTTTTATTQVETTLVVGSEGIEIDKKTTVDQTSEQTTELSLQEIQHPLPSQTSSHQGQIIGDHNNNHHRHNNHHRQEELQQQRLQLARQLVQDIRLVQNILEEHSLDPSLAPQLAVTIQSSQRIIESQRELEYQRALLDNHHRRLDRRISEKQHQERLKAVRYDPNWKEKLDIIRNKSWTFPSSVLRLGWDVFWIYQLSHGMIAPVSMRFYGCYFKHHRREISCLLDDAPSWKGFVLDMTWSVLAQVCDCPSERLLQEDYHSSSSSNLLTSTGSIFATGTTSTFTSSVTTSLLVIVKTFFHVLPVDQLSCYGYCLISGSLFLIITMLLHQGFRALSLPTVFHHTLNLTVLITFYGPQRTLDLFVSAYDRNYAVNSHQDDSSVGSSIMASTLLLLCLMPITSWARTRQVYEEVVNDVTQSSCFEEAFRRGQLRLERIQWEITLWRYSALVVYFGMILWQETL